MQNELINFEEIKNPELFTKDFAEKFCHQVKEKFGGLVFDISTKKGQEACKSSASKICSIKTAIEEFRKESTEGLRKKTAEINEHGKFINEFLQDLQDKTRKPLTDFKNKEKKRASERQDRIADMNKFYNIAIHNAGDAQKYLHELTTLEIFDWQEFEHEAKEIGDRARTYLAAKLQSELDREEKDKELEELRQFKAQKASEEAEKARIQHEENLKANAKKEAEEIAAKAIANAELRAKEAERLAKEQAENAAQKEREKIAQEKLAEEKAAAAREADTANKKKINNEIMTVLLTLLSEEQAKAMIKSIAKGQIPHVSIKY